MEVSNAMRTLKSEVKDEIRTSLRNLNQFLPDLPADLTAILERDDNLRELESVKENFPFTTNERIFEEKSNFPQVHIMVKFVLLSSGLSDSLIPTSPSKAKNRFWASRVGGKEGWLPLVAVGDSLVSFSL